MNTCTFIGNLTKDPVIRNTQSGKAVASFSIATNEDYVTPQGEKKQLTSYINIVVWGGLAQTVATKLQKGVRVLVQGRQSTRSYTGNDGQKRWVTEVVAQVIALPLRAPQQGAAPSNQYPQQPQGGQYQQPQGQGGGWSQFGQPTPLPTSTFAPDDGFPF